MKTALRSLDNFSLSHARASWRQKGPRKITITGCNQNPYHPSASKFLLLSSKVWKKDVAKDLPPKIEAEIPCKLNQEQATTYRKLAEQGMLDHGENLGEAIRQSPTHLFSLLTRLRQTCCDLGLLPGIERNESSGIKSEILLQKLDDLFKIGSKAIVFSQFTSYLQILEKDISKRLIGIKLLKLTGYNPETGPNQSKNFKAILILPLCLSLKAAGLGITLTTSRLYFPHASMVENPAVEQQAIDRAHRIGRQKPTFIYRLIAQGTIEERVRQLQISKKKHLMKLLEVWKNPRCSVSIFQI